MAISFKEIKHVAIVMDGNGRWAKKQGSLRLTGHLNGVNAAKNIIEYASNNGLSCLTLYAFSTENWNRPKKEVSFLLDLFVKKINQHIEELHYKQIRFKVIGELESLPKTLRNVLSEAVKLTSANTGMTLNVAINYGGRWDIVHAARRVAKQCLSGELMVDDISEDIFERNLSTGNLPAPDLLIRTSGESRLSNFLLWQLAYAELYFANVLWPDFTPDEFDKAINWYHCRDRRFGGVS